MSLEDTTHYYLSSSCISAGLEAGHYPRGDGAREKHGEARSQSDGKAEKRILWYLKGKTSIGRTYTEDADDGDNPTACMDSDCAGKMLTPQTNVVCHFFAGGPVNCTSNKQTVVAVSTVEVEHVAMSKACMMVTGFRNYSDSKHGARASHSII